MFIFVVFARIGMANEVKSQAEKRRFDVLAMLVVTLLICALLVGFISSRAIKVNLPHSDGNATLFVTEKIDNGPSFSLKAENIDKSRTKIYYQTQGYSSSGGSYQETITRFEDATVGYVFNETEGGARILRQYTCLSSNCSAPYLKQEYLYARNGAGEQITTCFFEGNYEMTINKFGTNEYSTVMGKGCPIK